MTDATTPGEDLAENQDITERGKATDPSALTPTPSRPSS